MLVAGGLTYHRTNEALKKEKRSVGIFILKHIDMKIDDYKKAEDIVSKIDAIEELTKEHTLGRVSDSIDFTENNDDFYNARFINVFETKGHHDTGGGSSTLERLTIAKYKDMSGAKYHLTKGETIQLQSFLKSMLEKRLNTLKNDLDNI